MKRRFTEKPIKAADAMVTQSDLQYTAMRAKNWLNKFYTQAKQYDGLSEHVTPGEMKMIENVVEILNDVQLGVYVTYEPDVDNHIV